MILKAVPSYQEVSLSPNTGIQATLPHQPFGTATGPGALTQTFSAREDCFEENFKSVATSAVFCVSFLRRIYSCSSLVKIFLSLGWFYYFQTDWFDFFFLPES